MNFTRLIVCIWLIAMGLPSCSWTGWFFQQNNPSKSSDSAEVKSKPAASPAESKPAAEYKPVGSKSSSSSSLMPDSSSLPSWVNAPAAEPEKDAEGAVAARNHPLPGDVRGRLRMPDLPDSLPMTSDGKVRDTE